MTSVSEEDIAAKSERIEHLEKMNAILLNMVKGRKGPEDVLKDALDLEDIDVVRYLFESEIVDTNTKVEQEFLGQEELLEIYYPDEYSYHKISPLVYAILMRSLKLVTFLLSVDGLDVNGRDDRTSPLTHAVHFSSHGIVTLLLKQKAIKFEPKYEIEYFMAYFPRIVNRRFTSGDDPENVWCILQLLIQHPSMTAPNMSSGLFHLVWNNPFPTDASAAYIIRAFKVLLADPRTDVNYKNVEMGSHTALHMTATVDIARLLVEAGADIFVQNSDNETPR
eukprot:939240_1